jgi:pimeloyl-ACP methyl ester carboxylesterase
VEMATGHLAPLERPEEFDRLLLDFLRSDPA